MKIVNSRKGVIGISVIIALFIFVLNCLTLYCADDYSYQYNLADGTSVNNIVDIFRALYDHYFVQSGRIFSHFFAYLFLWLPKPIFNIVNALMFLVQMLLVYKMSKAESSKHNIIIFLLIFAVIWVFEPSFGQVNLWVDGSCNYLFAIVFSLLFFASFVKEMREEMNNSKVKAVLWCLFSFMVGGYSENLSFCVIFGCILILIWNKFIEKRNWTKLAILKIVFALGGYAFMVFAPSTANKQAMAFSISGYLYNFKEIVYTYYDEFRIPLVVWVGAFVIAIYTKLKKEKLFLSAVCVAVSICSCLICMVAKYLSGRSMAGSLVFLVLAIMILAYDIWETNYQISVSLVAGYMVILTAMNLVLGCYDIMWTYNKTARREAYLSECAANGVDEVTVEIIDAQTRYSSSYRLPDLDTEDPTAYPNSDYEKYYGISVILGIGESSVEEE